MRLFVALDLPAAVRQRIADEVVEPLRQELRGVRWVQTDVLHVTLAFLGERSAREADEARTAVRELADGRAAARVTLQGLGVFPEKERPRVIWLGVRDPAPVRELHRAFERSRARLGVPAEGRAYHPHVTLGRVPPPAEADVRQALAPALAAVQFEARVTLDAVHLMQSELTPAGPRYTTLYSAQLARPEEH
ncbi:MAG TPA: RNA 2',3'-cyclic phosphodiesterase [Gemmatimonadaceae bacterium]|nr:RNA 2',3'-cyclic phosphodiesterase [Gemmatimonadaceae bacterium]